MYGNVLIFSQWHLICKFPCLMLHSFWLDQILSFTTEFGKMISNIIIMHPARLSNMLTCMTRQQMCIVNHCYLLVAMATCRSWMYVLWGPTGGPKPVPAFSRLRFKLCDLVRRFAFSYHDGEIDHAKPIFVNPLISDPTAGKSVRGEDSPVRKGDHSAAREGRHHKDTQKWPHV